MTPARAAVRAYALLLSAASAGAQPTLDECVDVNTRGQDMRHDGKLEAARALLARCADAACPAMVRADCTKRLDELDRAQPTLIFDVKDSAGRDVSAVKVDVDGRRVVERLDGIPVNVDPGSHVFTFETASGQKVTRTLLVNEGEKDRNEVIQLPEPAVPRPAAPGAVAPLPSGLGSRKTLALGLGATGVAFAAAGTVFGVVAAHAWSDAQTACGGDIHRCMDLMLGNSERGTTVTFGTLSTVGFVAAGALVGTGSVLFFTARQERRPGDVTIAPSMGREGPALTVVGAF